MLANPHGDGSTEDRVRRRLRELRLERGLSQEQVAEAAHLATSTLSRLESGKRRLALDHLPVLADALGVSVDELLLGTTTPPNPRVDLPPIELDGQIRWPLSRRGFQGLQVFRIRFDGTETEPPRPLPVHDGRDWLYVLRGRLRLVLDDHEHELGPGEVVEFGTIVPHWFGPVDGPVEVLAILGPDGEHAHQHPDPAHRH